MIASKKPGIDGNRQAKRNGAFWYRVYRSVRFAARLNPYDFTGIDRVAYAQRMATEAEAQLERQFADGCIPPPPSASTVLSLTARTFAIVMLIGLIGQSGCSTPEQTESEPETATFNFKSPGTESPAAKASDSGTPSADVEDKSETPHGRQELPVHGEKDTAVAAIERAVLALLRGGEGNNRNQN